MNVLRQTAWTRGSAERLLNTCVQFVHALDLIEMTSKFLVHGFDFAVGLAILYREAQKAAETTRW